MIKLSKSKNGNIKGSFEKDGKTHTFESQACYHKDNKEILKKVIEDNLKNSSGEHLVKELSRCDDRLLAYYL